MEKLRALIVDDEVNNRQILSKMILQFCPQVDVIGEAKNIDDAEKLIEEKQPSIVFLDVEMPGGSGFDLIDRFDAPAFDVIFITAHADYAIKALKMAAIDYLLKPISLTELREAVNKALQATNQGEKQNEKLNVLKSNHNEGSFQFNRIAIPSQDGLEFVKIDSIIRVEADRAYCKFFLKEGRTVLVSKSLKEFEDLLEEANFYRVHKSHMVNMDYVTKYVRGKGGHVVMEDGTTVGVAVRKKEEFLQRFTGMNITN